MRRWRWKHWSILAAIVVLGVLLDARRRSEPRPPAGDIALGPAETNARPSAGRAATGDARQTRSRAKPVSAAGGDTPRLLEDLRARHLKIPVSGVDRDDLRPSFYESRDGSRVHEALDILAPRHTPVVAVEDGTIVKLFVSKAGGKTVYHFDPTETYAYYYAHLEQYAPGLTEGMKIKRGQQIGTVGTSGNAPPNTPHLHFGIFRLTSEKRWWQGTPLDPYEAWAR